MYQLLNQSEKQKKEELDRESAFICNSKYSFINTQSIKLFKRYIYALCVNKAVFCTMCTDSWVKSLSCLFFLID